MKRLLALFAALIIFSVSCFPVFAAGINSAEQSVLGNMNTPADMNGNPVYVPASYINQAEAHFNTIDMTDAQASEINGLINSGRALLENSGKSKIQDLSSDEKQQLLSYASQAAGVLDLAVPLGVDLTHIKITNKDGEVIVDESESVIKTTGGESPIFLYVEFAIIAAALVLSCIGAIILKKKADCYE